MEGLPPRLADVLRPVLPTLADEIIEEIAREVPAYSGPLEGSFGRNIRVGVGQALERFVDLIADPETEAERGREIYVQLGRGEWREGRSLDVLLAAYRIGARVAWQRMAEAGSAAEVEPEVMYRLASAIFAYIDGLSAESADGYAAEQSAAAGVRPQRRLAVARLLLQEPPADPAAVNDAADGAGWPLPRTLAALALNGGDPEQLAGRIGPDVLACSDEGRATLLVPDPDGPGRRSQIETTLLQERGRTPFMHAALGPTLAPAKAARSVRRARLALELAERGALDAGGPLIVAGEHLAQLALASDAELAAEVAERTLAPLDQLKPSARERLVETLRAWLDHQGRVEETARVLDIHPQTVRYRLGQLREVFGTALDDPEGRFELALALRVSP